jgi:pyrimidine operon attenuation protein/uracil phosphoribosyltransferase
MPIKFTKPSHEQVVLAGIATNTFAQKKLPLNKWYSSLKSPYFVRFRLINKVLKQLPLLPSEQYTGKGLILLMMCVLNSGTTLIYAVHFSWCSTKKFKTVLVDRNHKNIPVKADFKGISLSTSLLEHVQVVFDGTNTSYA